MSEIKALMPHRAWLFGAYKNVFSTKMVCRFVSEP